MPSARHPARAAVLAGAVLLAASLAPAGAHGVSATAVPTPTSFGLVGTSTGYEQLTNLPSGTLHDKTAGPTNHAFCDPIAPDGNSAVTCDGSVSLAQFERHSGGYSSGPAIDLSAFDQEGGSSYGASTGGAALGRGFGLVGIDSQGVVQLRTTHGVWSVDTRVHSPGLNEGGHSHQAGLIRIPLVADATLYDGIAVSNVSLPNGKYLGLAIDRIHGTIAVIEGVGTATAHVAAPLASEYFGQLFGDDYGTGGMAFSSLTATKAAIETPVGVAVLNLSSPTHPKLQNITPINTGEGVATALAADPDGKHIAVASGEDIDIFSGLANTAASKKLPKTGQLVVPSNAPDTDAPIFDLAYLRSGVLIDVRTGYTDAGHTTSGGYADRITGTRTAHPSAGNSVALGSAPDQTDMNTLSVTPGAPTLSLRVKPHKTAKVGRPIKIHLTVKPGAGLEHYSVISGALPKGLKIRGSLIKGTPKKKGTKHFVLRAVNQYGGAVFLITKLTVAKR